MELYKGMCIYELSINIENRHICPSLPKVTQGFKLLSKSFKTEYK